MPISTSTTLRLTRAMRLRDSSDFTRVRTQGQRLVNGCLIANWMTLPPSSTARLGLVTSRKLGGAVARTRARRLLREVFRLHQRDLRLPIAMVLIARHSIVGKKMAEVEQDFLAALRQAGLLRITK